MTKNIPWPSRRGELFARAPTSGTRAGAESAFAAAILSTIARPHEGCSIPWESPDKAVLLRRTTDKSPEKCCAVVQGRDFDQNQSQT